MYAYMNSKAFLDRKFVIWQGQKGHIILRKVLGFGQRD